MFLKSSFNMIVYVLFTRFKNYQVDAGDSRNASSTLNLICTFLFFLQVPQNPGPGWLIELGSWIT